MRGVGNDFCPSPVLGVFVAMVTLPLDPHLDRFTSTASSKSPSFIVLSMHIGAIVRPHTKGNEIPPRLRVDWASYLLRYSHSYVVDRTGCRQ